MSILWKISFDSYEPWSSKYQPPKDLKALEHGLMGR